MIPSWYHLGEMKLVTKKTDYAARALKYISMSEKKTSITEISQELMIPKPFLRRIFQELEKANIVKSFKGKSGGFELARNAEDIYMLELIKLFQGSINFHECLIKNSICPDVSTCILKEKIDKIATYAEKELGTLTIKSIS